MKLLLLSIIVTISLVSFITVLAFCLFKIIINKKNSEFNNMQNNIQYEFPFTEEINDTTLKLLNETKHTVSESARLSQGLVHTTDEIRVMNINTVIPTPTEKYSC